MNRSLVFVFLLLSFSKSIDCRAQDKKNQSKYIYVDTPRLLRLDEVIPILFKWELCTDDHREKFIGLYETNRDDTHIYFREKTYKSVNKYRALLTDLGRIKYERCKAKNIKDSFFKTFVPVKDRRRDETILCPTTPTEADYTYRYIDSLNALEIRLHWKIYCEIIFKMVNKKYAALYYFDTGVFKQID